MSYREDSRYGGTYAEPEDRYDDRDESGYEESYEAEPDAREYINTVKSVFLAIMKLITGLMGLAMIVVTIVGLAGLSEQLHRALLNAGFERETVQFINQIPWNELGRTTNIWGILYLVVVISLMLSVALNGIGSFLLRVAKHGATCVQIAHIVYTVFNIILFVLWCVLITLLIIGLAALGSAAGQAGLRLDDIGRAMGSTAWLWIYLISMIVLVFMLLIGKFSYHLSVAKVMSHTRKELSQGRLLAMSSYNKLPGRCIFLVVVYGLIMTLNIVSILMINEKAFMGLSPVSTGSIIPNLSDLKAVLLIMLIPSGVLLVFRYLRLFFVMACARDFNRAHF